MANDDRQKARPAEAGQPAKRRSKARQSRRPESRAPASRGRAGIGSSQGQDRGSPDERRAQAVGRHARHRARRRRRRRRARRELAREPRARPDRRVQGKTLNHTRSDDHAHDTGLRPQSMSRCRGASRSRSCRRPRRSRSRPRQRRKSRRKRLLEKEKQLLEKAQDRVVAALQAHERRARQPALSAAGRRRRRTSPNTAVEAAGRRRPEGRHEAVRGSALGAREVTRCVVNAGRQARSPQRVTDGKPRFPSVTSLFGDAVRFGPSARAVGALTHASQCCDRARKILPANVGVKFPEFSGAAPRAASPVPKRENQTGTDLASSGRHRSNPHPLRVVTTSGGPLDGPGPGSKTKTTSRADPAAATGVAAAAAFRARIRAGNGRSARQQSVPRRRSPTDKTPRTRDLRDAERAHRARDGDARRPRRPPITKAKSATATKARRSAPAARATSRTTAPTGASPSRACTRICAISSCCSRWASATARSRISSSMRSTTTAI